MEGPESESKAPPTHAPADGPVTAATVTRAARVAASLVLLVIGVALAGAAILLGVLPVTAGVGAKCGSAFSKSSTSALDLTDTGADTCERERADRQSLVWTLVAAGGVVLVGAGLVHGGGGTTDSPSRASSATPQDR